MKWQVDIYFKFYPTLLNSIDIFLVYEKTFWNDLFISKYDKTNKHVKILFHSFQNNVYFTTFFVGKKTYKQLLIL